jgi:fatty acid desaturase
VINPEEKVRARDWFTCDIPKQEMKALLKRDDWHALLYVGGWLALMVGFGYLASRLYPSAWAIPAFFVYGVVYSSNNAKWHECSHGTAFKTPWLNELLYFVGGAMEFRDPVDFRWSHARHHSYTIIKGIDPEIAAPRPPNLLFVVLDFFYLQMGFQAVKGLVLHSLGVPTKHVKEYVPESEYIRLFWGARAVLVMYLAVIALAVYLRSWLPVLLFGLPRFYGAFFAWAFIALQHVGLAENVWDHRLNTRSLRFDPFLSFLFMNMENHVEHHMYPMVPFHALPRLRERIKGRLPQRYPGIWNGWRELIPVLLAQGKDPGVFIRRPLP